MTISLNIALETLVSKDVDLKRIYNTIGAPPNWQREASFATLVHIILEQQVSLASAQAAFDKLATRISPVEPESFLVLDDAELKRIGFSWQKTRYCRILAEAIATRQLDLIGLKTLSDEEARAELIKLTGIGVWTANIFLMMALERSDIWPRGDLALLIAYQRLKGLQLRPSQDELEFVAESWKPFRSLAAKLLWHYYLSA